MSQHYDYLIAGAGCAGLSLAWRLVRSGLGDAKILILDPDPKRSNDRTWCFWQSEEPDLPCLPSRVWDRLEVLTFAGELDLQIAPFRYYHVNGQDYYDQIRETLAAHPQVTWRQERVLTFQEQGGHVEVMTQVAAYTATWAFSSIRTEIPSPKKSRDWGDQVQHFAGWFIETEHPVFDPDKVVFMDFTVEQEEDVRFYYVLPFSETKALVEFTVFSREAWREEAYEPFLEDYLARLQAKGSGSIQLEGKEKGAIPMTTDVPDRWQQPRVMRIGLAGGSARAGTGYAFSYIQRETQQIVDSLARYGRPILKKSHTTRHMFYDSLLLYLVDRRGGRMHEIFGQLFRRQPAARVLRFLGEDSSWSEEFWIMARLPWAPFLRALWAHVFAWCWDLITSGITTTLPANQSPAHAYRER